MRDRFRIHQFYTGIERASTCAAYCAVSQPTWLLLRSVYQRDLKYPIVPNRHYSDSASKNVTPVCSQNPDTQQSPTCIGCSLATFTDIRRMSLRLSCTLGRCLQSRTCSLLCFRSCLSWRKELTSAWYIRVHMSDVVIISLFSSCYVRSVNRFLRYSYSVFFSSYFFIVFPFSLYSSFSSLSTLLLHLGIRLPIRFLWLFICFVSSTSLCNRCSSHRFR